MPKFFMFTFFFQLDNESFLFHSCKLTFSFPLEINNPDSTCLPFCIHNVQLLRCSQAVSGEFEKILYPLLQEFSDPGNVMKGGKRKPKGNLIEAGLFQQPHSS